MKVAVGCDHAGFELAESLRLALTRAGHEVVDFGTVGTASVDYPDFAFRVGEAVASAAVDKGVLVCGTGIGMSIAANKVMGVRAAVVHDLFTAKLAAEHNGANVLCLGGRLYAPEFAWEMVKTWLETKFEERHQVRLDKISLYEGKARG